MVCGFKLKKSIIVHSQISLICNNKCRIFFISFMRYNVTLFFPFYSSRLLRADDFLSEH